MRSRWAVLALALAGCLSFDKSGFEDQGGDPGTSTSTSTTASSSSSSSGDSSSNTTSGGTTLPDPTTQSSGGEVVPDLPSPDLPEVEPDPLAPFAEPQLIVELNDPTWVDRSPILLEDERTIVFSSNRPPWNDRGLKPFISRRNSVEEPWGAPSRIRIPDFDDAEVLAAAVLVAPSPPLPEGTLHLWFSSNKDGDYDLFEVFVGGNSAMPPLVKLAFSTSSAGVDETHFALSGQLAAFVCIGSGPSFDIHRTQRASAASGWETPVPFAGPNGMGDDCGPFVVAGDAYFFFTSNSHGHGAQP